jgi:hypothetical protein
MSTMQMRWCGNKKITDYASVAGEKDDISHSARKGTIQMLEDYYIGRKLGILLA